MFERYEFIEVVEFSEYCAVNLDKTVTDVVKLLKQRHETIATAESCTGGMLSAYLTSVDGASAVFECGICTYANRIKEMLVHVPHSVLEEYGAVSRQTASAMVQGIRELTGADLCVSVTGIAGPQGGTPDKPVGTVFVGFCYHEKQWVYLLKLWHADGHGRSFNRETTAAFVMKTAEKILMEEDS
ncbi:MAG: CinA family protein [Oscillospiraceae bacterium]|jgi:nicotinamide-nucleotide amidase|nr:CinA family protein [Oscillospiraceae bacterium]MBQ9110588.1 CinA family protein [Oscillospiraceae bacterium]